MVVVVDVVSAVDAVVVVDVRLRKLEVEVILDVAVVEGLGVEVLVEVDAAVLVKVEMEVEGVVVDVIALHTVPDEPVNMLVVYTLESAWVRVRVKVNKVKVSAKVYLGINPSGPTQRPAKRFCSKEHPTHVHNA